MERQLGKSLGEMNGIKLFCISAKTGRNLTKIMDEVLRVNEKWNFRVNTGQLNEWFQRFKKVEKAPTEKGEMLRIRFVSQIKTRPPTFTLFINDKSLLKDNYLKFFSASLSAEFGLQGIPIRMIVRDIKYQKVKKNYEKQNPGELLRETLLQKRKQSNILKEKLINLDQKMKQDDQKNKKQFVFDEADENQ